MPRSRTPRSRAGVLDADGRAHDAARCLAESDQRPSGSTNGSICNGVIPLDPATVGRIVASIHRVSYIGK